MCKMKLEPENLGISLERKDYLAYWLTVACLLVIFISAFFNPAFAMVFAASSLVGIPVLWLTLIKPTTLRFFSTGIWRSVLLYLVIFAYIAVAKKILVPILLNLIQAAIT